MAPRTPDGKVVAALGFLYTVSDVVLADIIRIIFGVVLLGVCSLMVWKLWALKPATTADSTDIADDELSAEDEASIFTSGESIFGSGEHDNFPGPPAFLVDDGEEATPDDAPPAFLINDDEEATPDDSPPAFLVNDEASEEAPVVDDPPQAVDAWLTTLLKRGVKKEEQLEKRAANKKLKFVELEKRKEEALSKRKSSRLEREEAKLKKKELAEEARLAKQFAQAQRRADKAALSEGVSGLAVTVENGEIRLVAAVDTGQPVWGSASATASTIPEALPFSSVPFADADDHLMSDSLMDDHDLDDGTAGSEPVELDAWALSAIAENWARPEGADADASGIDHHAFGLPEPLPLRRA